MIKNTDLQNTKNAEKIVMDMMKTIHEAEHLVQNQETDDTLPFIPKSAIKDSDTLSQRYVDVETLNDKFSKYEPHIASDIKYILQYQINHENADDYDGKGNALYKVLYKLDDYMKDIDPVYCDSPEYKFFAGSVTSDKLLDHDFLQVIDNQISMQKNEIVCKPMA